MNRRDFLAGNLVGLVGGAGAVWGAGRLASSPFTEIAAIPPGRALEGVTAAEAGYLHPSFAQQGEDLVLLDVFDVLKIAKPSYLDIGAFDPIAGSNTYLFYKLGARGVLVEPNPVCGKRLREVRKEDVLLQAGIGVTDATEADYYVVEGDGQRNGFSRENVDELSKRFGHDVLKAVVKMPMLRLNAVLEQHFKDAPPALVSIDTEGMDLAILQTLDFARWRPKAFVVEASVLPRDAADASIAALMASKGYAPAGGNLVNTVFVDRSLFG